MDDKLPLDDEDITELDNPILQAFLALDKATPSDEGMDYKPLYYDLYRGIGLIIDHTITYEQTIEALKVLQCKAEEYFISQG